MSLLSVGHYTSPHGPAIDKEWDRLDKDAEAYAEQFYIPNEIQDSLPGFERFDRRDPYLTVPEYISEYLREHTEYQGFTINFMVRNIAARACWAGMVGSIDTNQQQSSDEQYLIVENTENYFGPKPSEKMDKQSHGVRIFNKEELTEYVKYWYRIGAADRLDGTIIRRGLEDQSTELAEEWPLVSEGLRLRFYGPNMDQETLPGMRDEAKERIYRELEEQLWQTALRDAKKSGSVDHIPYGEAFHETDIQKLIEDAARLLDRSVPPKDSEEYAELRAMVMYMNDEEVEEMEDQDRYWEDD